MAASPKPTLAERLAGKKRRGCDGCPVGKWLGSIDASLASEYETVIADDAYTNVGIIAAMREDGYEFGRSTLQAHRSKGCACHR